MFAGALTVSYTKSTKHRPISAKLVPLKAMDVKGVLFLKLLGVLPNQVVANPAKGTSEETDVSRHLDRLLINRSTTGIKENEEG